MKSRFLPLLFVFACASSAFANAPLNTLPFRPRTFASWEFAILRSPVYPKTPTAESMDTSLSALASDVHYTGNVRALSPEKAKFIETLGKLVLKRDDLGQVYKREVQVLENGFSYWVAVQENLIPQLEAELKPDAEFKVYYHYGGVAARRQHVYLLVEFDSPSKKN